MYAHVWVMTGGLKARIRYLVRVSQMCRWEFIGHSHPVTFSNALKYYHQPEHDIHASHQPLHDPVAIHKSPRESSYFAA